MKLYFQSFRSNASWNHFHCQIPFFGLLLPKNLFARFSSLHWRVFVLLKKFYWASLFHFLSFTHTGFEFPSIFVFTDLKTKDFKNFKIQFVLLTVTALIISDKYGLDNFFVNHLILQFIVKKSRSFHYSSQFNLIKLSFKLHKIFLLITINFSNQ